jgi:tetratricopeptide (TPR) repeat protein
MNRRKSHNIRNQESISWHDSWNEKDMLFNDSDAALFESVGGYIKGMNDLEEVKNDPDLASANTVVKQMIADYRKKTDRRSDNERFISDILNEADRDKKIVDEIKNIKLEINEKQINELTAEWVKEWHERRQKSAGHEEKNSEIKNFITDSLNNEVMPEEQETVTQTLTIASEKPHKKRIFRYSALSAAAALAFFMLIRTLLPSADPDKLFNSYYEPFKIISPVTRDASVVKDNLSIAIEDYNRGDYQTAVAGFTAAMNKDTRKIAPGFYLGLTQMALGNYGLAENLLKEISDRNEEYSKEARWYLALSYLKTGNTDKAKEYFGLLARNDGFYSERAGKLLRRLK